MFCPKCKSEYRDGYDRCPECNCRLVENLPEEQKYKTSEPSFLCEASDDFEAEIILAKLKSDGIYAFKRYRGSDGYNMILLGRAILGIDIFVSSADLKTAQEILAAK